MENKSFGNSTLETSEPVYPIYEINTLGATKKSILEKLKKSGGRISFIVYEGKIVISLDGLHTTITKNLGIRENEEEYCLGAVYKLSSRLFCPVLKKVNGKEEDISFETEGENIRNYLLKYLEE